MDSCAPVPPPPTSGRKSPPDKVRTYQGAASCVHPGQDAEATEELGQHRDDLRALYPAGLGRMDITSLREFFIRDVLVYEIAHHVDQRPYTTTKERECFAEAFALEHGSGTTRLAAFENFAATMIQVSEVQKARSAEARVIGREKSELPGHANGASHMNQNATHPVDYLAPEKIDL